jgi:hypothetical protein
VSFNFPTDAHVGPRGFLLVVSFDPVANPTALAAFRSKYSLPLSVPILGPYSGKLDNGGENVSLLRPDSPQTSGPEAGFVPHILVDQVEFADAGPWPQEPDGSGSSLQRRRPYSYGNESVNWASAAPTPGRPNVPGSSYTDADSDGISDSWEASNGLSSANPADANADADGDGRSNWAEFLDGTNPQSAGSLLVAPVITQQPLEQTVSPGANVLFTVAATGSAPLSYQWRFNGSVLPDANAAALTLTNVDVPSAGRYDVVAWNAAGFAWSQAARLTVNIPPAIFIPPQSQVVNTNTEVTFSVVAVGTGTLRYQWQFNGVNLANATNASLTITGTRLDHEGDYRVLVTDDVATVSSASARLTVRVPPTILIAPRGQTNVVGSSLTFSLSCSGSVPMGFLWRKGSQTLTNIGNNGWIVLNTTNCSVTLSNLQAQDSATYRVIVTNSGAPLLSTNASWSVLIVAPPVITNPPVSQLVSAGADVTFAVGAAGSPPLAYQWHFQNSPLPNATNTTLSLTNVQPANEGAYHVVVTNLGGSAASPAATLTLLGRPLLSTPEWLANPVAFRFKLQGPPGNYAIEVSTNLQQWATMTNLLSPGGVVSFTDTTADGRSQRYYRARAVP